MKKLSFLIFIILYFLFTVHCFAQMPGQKIIDSIQTLLKTEKNDTTKVNSLDELSFDCYIYGRPDDGIKYGEQETALSQQLKWQKGIASANNVLGACYLSKNDYSKSLSYFKESIKINTALGRKASVSSASFNIGNVYLTMADYQQATDYFYKSYNIAEEIKDSTMLISCNTAFGAVYSAVKDNKMAIKYFLDGLKIAELYSKTEKMDMANLNMNLGIAYQYNGDFDNAIKYSLGGIKLNDEASLYTNSANLYGNISLAYTNHKDYRKAVENGFKSLDIASRIHARHLAGWALYETGHAVLSYLIDSSISTKTGKDLLNDLIPTERKAQIAAARDYFKWAIDSINDAKGDKDLSSKIYPDLAKTYELAGDDKMALDAYKVYMALKDFATAQENNKKITAAHIKHEQEKKDAIAETEIQKQKLVRNGFVGGFAVVLLFAGVFFRQRNKISKGKKRSDDLLLNILPVEVAEELKEKGSADAKQFDDVTVLFTDFKGFTQLSEKLTPIQLVAEINECFSAFDLIMQKYEIEKIKTIGDSYMAAGGLPTPNKTHATDVVKAALEIQQFMKEHKAKKEAEGKLYFEIRIGVHSGPVVAGIVGIKKFAYDIWGDTVNTASRMESSGEVGQVNISGSTYEIIKNDFKCVHRGKVKAKNKGEVDMYFVEG